MIALLLATALQSAAPQLVEVGVGRFAVYADIASIQRDGDIARIRALQVAEADFHVGDVAYVGGWSRWAFDCAAHTADRLDFASLRADGVEGPATPESAPPYPAAPGGDAAELLAVACGETEAGPALTLDAAIRAGQSAMAE